MDSAEISEIELIELLRNYYMTCPGHATPLKYLKQYFGRGFKFEHLGFGKWGSWFHQNQHHFDEEREEQKKREFTNTMIITEVEILQTVQEFFDKSEAFAHRKHVLDHLRQKYSFGQFSNLGFGTFSEFLQKYGMNMGYAKRADFKLEHEWRIWLRDGGRIAPTEIVVLTKQSEFKLHPPNEK